MTGQKTLIIGNGFDLNLGLRTSYSHFLDTCCVEDSNLMSCLLENRFSKNQRWVDVEKELKSLVLNPPYIKQIEDGLISGKPFNLRRKDYDDLKQMLKCYLLDQKLNSDIDYCQTSAYQLILKLFDVQNFQLVILNFNYTDTLVDLLNIINQTKFTINTISNQRIYKNNYHHVHGDLSSEKNIVFGIDDKAGVPDEFDFILKAFDRNATSLNINKILYESDEIYFFGYSLGETDTSYFDDFFRKLCEYNNLEENDKKKLNFYYYKEEGYKETISRIKHLTNSNLTKLKQYNTINFFDCDLNE